MTDLMPFAFDSGSCRFGMDDDGTPWVVASDFAKLMGHRDAANALRILDEVERGTRIMSTSESSGRVADRPVSVIFEDGIWELVFRSTLPGAKAIKARVKAILREIRETGRYGTAPVALPSKRELAQMVIEAEDRADVAESKLAIAAPKAEYVDAFVNNDDATKVRVLANQLGVQEKALRAYLVRKKRIYRSLEGSRWSRSAGRVVAEYSWHAHAEYNAWFVERDQPEAPRLHNGQAKTTLYVTPVGKVRIAEMLRRDPIEVAS